MTKRRPRKLLKAAALSAGTMLVGCGSQVGSDPRPLPGNPKGSTYDDETVEVVGDEGRGSDEQSSTTPASETTAPETDTAADDQGDEDTPSDETDDSAEPRRPIPLPANPKGSHYGDGPFAPRPAPQPTDD